MRILHVAIIAAGLGLCACRPAPYENQIGSDQPAAAPSRSAAPTRATPPAPPAPKTMRDPRAEIIARFDRDYPNGRFVYSASSQPGMVLDTVTGCVYAARTMTPIMTGPTMQGNLNQDCTYKPAEL
jgi:hypothetical protein